MKKTILIFLIPLFLVLTNTYAETKKSLPTKSKRKFETMQKGCPECMSKGFMACGNTNIRYNKKFDASFFQGNPPKGYLLNPPYTSYDFKKLARGTESHEELLKKLMEIFLKIKLVVVTDEYKEVYSLGFSQDVTVVFPKKLHSCIKDRAKEWGCGLDEKECCEKDLGSPVIEVKWEDKKTNETIMFSYSQTIGSTKLYRESENKKDVYFCLTGTAGHLK